MTSPNGASDRERQLVPDTSTARTPRRPTRKHLDAGFLFVASVTIVSASVVWQRHGHDRVLEILLSGCDLLVGIAPKVLAAVFLAAWLRLLLPREKVSRYFGGRQGLRGMSLAVLFGIVIPGGPMTAFPLAVAFFQAGAGFGVLVAFLSSWLLLGANRTIVWEMAFLSYDVVGLRYLLSLPVPFLMGWLAQVFERAMPGQFAKVTAWR